LEIRLGGVGELLAAAGADDGVGASTKARVYDVAQLCCTTKSNAMLACEHGVVHELMNLV
jgi:hypothetical protein